MVVSSRQKYIIDMDKHRLCIMQSKPYCIMVDMYFTHGKVTLHYEIYGNGYPLIMLHGNGEDITIFSKAIEKLESTFTIYAIDTRGHGKSSPIHEYHYSDMADDLYAFITELGIERPAIFGFSDGGITALMLGYTHPEAVSAIIASGANSSPKGLKTLYRFGYRKLSHFYHDPKIGLMLREPQMTKEDLEKITVPVLLTAGSKDMIKKEDTEFLHSSIRGSSLMILEGEGHASYVADSDKIAEIIKDFLI